MKQGLSQVQAQSLKMTNAMAVSLKVMQMSSLELANFTNKELQENPMLEEDDDWENHDSSFDYIKVKNYSYELDVDDLAEEISLKQKIIDQINLSPLDQKQRFIALYLTDYLNPNGYLDCDLTIAANLLKCKSKEIENIILELQNFEPTGVFARNLGECLALQLEERKELTKSAKIILDNLDLLAKNELTKLAKVAKISQDEVIAFIHKIKTLNPKPAINFAPEKSYTKIPDVVISKANNDEFTINLASHSAPKIKVKKDFYNMARNKVNNKDEKQYVKEQYSSASNLLKAIDKRNQTTLKTAIAIFEKQKSFFEYGIMELKPMTLSEISKLTDLHESTISRITTGKYIATPFGVFEMKDFFTSKITNNAGIEISSAKIKEMIKAIISTESKGQIYSDDDLSSELKKFNLTAARRTIAKYREELKIPTSSMRKREIARL